MLSKEEFIAAGYEDITSRPDPDCDHLQKIIKDDAGVRYHLSVVFSRVAGDETINAAVTFSDQRTPSVFRGFLEVHGEHQSVISIEAFFDSIWRHIGRPYFEVKS